MTGGTPLGNGPRRRLILLGIGVGAVGALSGCGVHLQEDAPDIPVIPRRTRMPGEAALLDLLAGTQALVTATKSAGTELTAVLTPLHVTQVGVLRDALRRGRVPSSVIAPADRTPSPVPGATPNSVGLAAAEASVLGDRTPYAAFDAALAAPVMALLAQRAAATTLLGGHPPAPNPPAPNPPSPAATTPSHAGIATGEPTPGAPAPSSSAASPAPSPSATPRTADDPGLSGLLVSAREAVQFLQVVQARAPKDDTATGLRARALDTQTWLSALTQGWEQALGDEAPPASATIALPFAVDSPEAGARLAAEALTRVRAAYGRRIATLSVSAARKGWGTFPDELADIEVHAHAWGVALQAFPGLS
ncbi:MAG TPA: hypothetical protein PLX71_00450 [Phycicoccus sp.]|nr:hypothetical protein [Phycicoccus sp.]